LQLATDQRCAIIDPLTIKNLRALIPLFTKTETVKVFHAGIQDLEIILQELELVPSPIFDTQLAAELLGISQQTSLSTIVKTYCEVKLDKSDSYTDWAERPLKPTQISYALDDVRYLPYIYAKMQAKLDELGRSTWLQEDFDAMSDADRYRVLPEDAWKKVKHSSKLTLQQLGVLREVAACRERIAARRNLPRKWVVSDELLVEIARISPQNHNELYHLRGAQNQLGENWACEILKAVHRGVELSEEQLPVRKGVVIRSSSHVAAHDMMRVLLNQRARDNRISQSMLANKDDLVRLANGQREGIKLLVGWRYKLIGKELLELLEGNLTLRLDNDKVEVEKH
jgi:ribonuclease D